MPEKKSTSTANISEMGPYGSELGRATYSAQQVPGAVIVFAMGCHPTSGYVDFFEQSPLRIFPPQFIFRTIPPSGIVLPVLTPFSLWVMFEATEPVETVTVHDADGAHEIKVEQVPDIVKSGPWVSGSVMRGGDQGIAVRAIMERATTMATGEEGGGGPTTMATGEENISAPTTMATGEEGGGGPTTMATGEEETRMATTFAVGEEGPGPTTMALGEEGPGMTTFALGEEGPRPTTFALGEEGGMTTFALGEETGGIPTPQVNNPFGGF